MRGYRGHQVIIIVHNSMLLPEGHVNVCMCVCGVLRLSGYRAYGCS